MGGGGGGGGEQGEWNPGVKGTGSLREAGEEREESGIPKEVGTGMGTN